MKKILFTFLFIILFVPVKQMFSQTTLDTAVNFHVKTIEGDPLWLFDILDNDNKIVVIDFFSTGCSYCQTYAPDFQASYEDFGENSSNVYYMGINWGADNEEVRIFDSTYNLTYPSISGVQGGGNGVFTDYNILSYPTVIVIVPEDHIIKNKEITPPLRDSINKAVIAAGGIMVGIEEENKGEELTIYPNPVGDIAFVKMNFSPKTNIKVSVFDLYGRSVVSTRTISKGNTHFSVNMQHLNNGIYFIRITYNHRVVTRQIIKTS